MNRVAILNKFVTGRQKSVLQIKMHLLEDALCSEKKKRGSLDIQFCKDVAMNRNNNFFYCRIQEIKSFTEFELLD